MIKLENGKLIREDSVQSISVFHCELDNTWVVKLVISSGGSVRDGYFIRFPTKSMAHDAAMSLSKLIESRSLSHVMSKLITEIQILILAIQELKDELP